MSDLGVLAFRLLGPLEGNLEGVPVSLSGRKQRSLLTFLLLHENEAVSADVIVDALWDEQPPETAHGALQVYVSQLRKVLEPGHAKNDPYRRLLTEATGYRLQLGPDDELDLRNFERLFEQGRGALAEGAPAQASARFAEALSLWRGPPLADFAYEQFAQGEIARLEELRLACLEERMEAELALGHHIELVGELDSLVRANPLRERLRAQLMLALYRCGRQADALEVYQQARGALVEELGIEPSTELQALNRAILNQEEAIAAPARIERPVQLPVPATPLVGRVRELAEVTALLGGETRLLTLTGPGGVGKTRLATAAAADAECFPDGKVWIDLQALRDPELVAPAIAQALGGQGEVGALIGERQMLLCLDNLEQLLPAIAPELGRLLETARHVSLIATSREPLRLSGEHEYPLGPLREADAAALFFQRARAVRPDFDETDEVGAICRRLDGLPLALELAAARVKLLTPEMILGRLEHRLQLLTGGARDAPERHQTLRATIDWSYELLNEEERGSFARLSVFAGGFTLEAAEEVCETELDTLASLLDKSLIRAEGGRFSMLEAIREYAIDCMEASGEARALRDAHAAWCLRLAEAASSALRDDEAPTWFKALAREHDNFRAALAWTKLTGALTSGPASRSGSPSSGARTVTCARAGSGLSSGSTEENRCRWTGAPERLGKSRDSPRDWATSKARRLMDATSSHWRARRKTLPRLYKPLKDSCRSPPNKGMSPKPWPFKRKRANSRETRGTRPHCSGFSAVAATLTSSPGPTTRRVSRLRSASSSPAEWTSEERTLR